MAMAIFSCRPNSHPFEERTVLFPEAIKIGRSVAKSRPAASNCIFDCKVLSRNHAILWYEHGKFFLQDTKSSNGTFVNNVRLSKGSEESEPKELKSGDIVQFGVDVVENSKKVTHGCIVASLTLYDADGKEATRSGVAKNVFGLNENGIQAQEMWQLSQYLQDALYREQMLENKLATLQRVISNCRGLQENHTQTFVQEEKLLSRLETLENQLETLTRNLSEEDIKRELLLMQEDRHAYEMKAKESLRRLLQEKLEAIHKLSDVEKSCASAEDECLHFKSLYERSQDEMKDLSDKHKERLDEMQSLRDQEEEAERRHVAVEEQATKDRQELVCKLEDAESMEVLLSTKLNMENQSDHMSTVEANQRQSSKCELNVDMEVESLQADCDFTKEQLAAMKAQMDKAKEELQQVTGKQENDLAAVQRENSSEERIEPVLNGTRELEQEPPELPDNPRREENGTDSVDSSTDDVKLVQAQLERLQQDVTEKETLIISVKEQLDKARNKAQENQNEVNRLKGELRDLRSEGEEDKRKLQHLEEQVMDYHLQAIDELSLPDEDSIYVEEEETVQECTTRVPSLAIEEEDLLMSPEPEDDQSGLLLQLQERIHDVRNFLKEKHCTFISWSVTGREKSNNMDEETTAKPSSPTSDESHESNWMMTDCIEGVDHIEEEFKEVAKLMESEHDEHELLKEELKNAQAYTKDFKKQILDLRDKLLEEQDVRRQKDEFVAQLRRELNELTRERDMAQVEKKCEHHAVESAKNAAREMQKQAAKSAEKAGKNKVELSAVTEENRSLKQRIQTLESELKKYRRENNRMLSEHSRLQASYREVESQSRHQHEKLVRQQSTLKDQVEKHTSERRNSATQAGALGERLQETELRLKEKEEQARMELTEEKYNNERLRNYLTAAVALFVAFFMAYLCDLISVSAGGRLSWR